VRKAPGSGAFFIAETGSADLMAANARPPVVRHVMPAANARQCRSGATFESGHKRVPQAVERVGIVR